MSSTVWGIVWVRDIEKDDDPCWYESAEDAIYEFNQRDDKYWASRLVTGEITQIKTEFDGNHQLPPWGRGYEDHYYEPEEGLR